MKKLFIIFSFLSIYINIIAQTPIKGVVIDKESGDPISDVIVQYGNLSNDYIYTDEKGVFSIPANSNDIIHFQCFGYKTKSISKAILLKNTTVEMELNPVSLNPVIISPDDAHKLLEEVMINTKKKLVTGMPLGYFLHFLQTRSSDTTKNEIYMKYTTSLKEKDLKKNLKKERVPYIYNIVDIKREHRATIPTSELYGAEYHASHLFTFGKSSNNKTSKSYNPDSSLIYLEIKPLEGKSGWAKGEVTINGDDMTIASMEVESVDSILDAQPYKKYLDKQVKILRKVGRFEFKKVKDKLYMKECYTYYKFRAVNEFGIEEDFTYHCDVNFIGGVDPLKIKNRKLSGFCQELFYFPDSTQDEFWLAYEDTGVYAQIEREFDENFVTSTYDKHKTTSYILKAAIAPIALFAIFLVVL
ncbi:MAG: carboxypeptidase-like regulatory domain-containing protein [Dysgonomonas sp.]